ncbi:MAG: DUF433 domain-containing protein [Chitinophagales bacterium]|nr:DUF433 domain-containing protein [Chitinophagales bacterium]
MKPEDERKLLDRITLNPKVLAGKQTIRGYRLSVDHILKALASGQTIVELKKDYPFLEQDDINASLLYASRILEEEKIYSIPGLSLQRLLLMLAQEKQSLIS